MWDGNISLYNIKTKLFPIGLYPRLKSYCDENSIDLVFKKDDRFDTISDIDEDLSIEEIKSFVNDLNLWSKNGPITAREYQLDAVFKAIKNKRLTLVSPTSSGKSLLIYCIIRWILDEIPDSRVLLLVPNVTLVNQMFGDFREYSSQNGWDVDKNCQKLYSGLSKELSKRVLITTWQSFTKIANDKVNGPKILSLYKGVIADECHTSKGKEMQSILEKCHYASYRIGTTGTIDTSADAKVHTLQIEGFLGSIYKVITTKELIDTNQVSNLKIKSLVLKYTEDECKLIKTAEYQEEINWLIENPERNKFLIRVALAAEGTTLLLVRNRDTHAKVLYEKISEISKRPVYYVSGNVSADEREKIRQTANKEDCIIVATFQTMSTGVNIPNIRNVIFGSPSKSSITVLQSIGRGLRLHSDKTHMTLYDIIDDLRYKKSENYSYVHGVERLSIYRKEKFDISIKEITL
jgi:superfamily II DNA or RNA helicase